MPSHQLHSYNIPINFISEVKLHYENTLISYGQAIGILENNNNIVGNPFSQKVSIALVKIKNLIKSVLNSFHFSVIQGEYYADSITQLLLELNPILVSIQSKHQDLIKKLTSQKLTSQIDEVESLHTIASDFFEYYSFLTYKIQARLNKSEFKVFDLYLTDNIDFSHFGSLNNHNNLNLLRFKINIQLALIDEGYLCDEKILVQLSNYYVFLYSQREKAKITNDFITNFLIDKASFLILKIYHRFNKTELVRIIEGVNKYEFNFSNLESSLRNSKFSNYKEYIDKLLHHYHNDSLIITVDTSFPDTDSVEKIHHYCKGLKNLSKSGDLFEDAYSKAVSNLNQLCNGISNVLKRLKKEKKVNDYFAYLAAESIVNNTLFKIQCNFFLNNTKKILENKNSLEKIKEVYSKLSETEYEKDSFQIELIFSRFIKSLLHKISKQIDSFDDYEKLSKIKTDLLDLFYTSNNKLRHNIQSNVELRLMPIYLTMPECYTSISYTEGETTKTINQFTDSGYILPSDYSSLILECDKLLIEVRNVDITIHNFYYKFQEKIFEQKIKENQFQTITVIGLYAAIITFILGSLSSATRFQFSKVEFFMFMVVFAFCISLFVLLLRLLFAKPQKLLVVYLSSFLLLIATIYSITSLNSKHSILEDNQIYLDTLRISKQKQFIEDSINSHSLYNKIDTLEKKLKALRYQDSIKKIPN